MGFGKMKRAFYGMLFFAGYILCLLTFTLFIGCGDKEETVIPGADEFINEGWKEYAAGNYADAIIKFQKALEDDPDSSEAYNGVGWSMAKLSQLVDSIDSFKKAVEKDPLNIDANVGLAGVYFATGDYERAVASGKSALSIEPQYVSHHDNIKAYHVRVLMAECYYIVGDYTQAVAQIDLLGGAGISLDPASPTYQADLISVIDSLSNNNALASLGN